MFACIVFSSFNASAFAVDWYVRPGEQSYGTGDGSSYENAWGGFKSIEWDKIKPGDTVWLDGNAEYKNKLVIQTSGNQNNWITIRGDYGGKRAKITVVSEIEDSSGNLWNSDAVSWVKETGVGPNVWSASNMCRYLHSPGRLYIDNTEYPSASSVETIDSFYRWYYNSTEFKLYLYATSMPKTAYFSLKGSQEPAAVMLENKKSYIRIHDLDVVGGYYESIKFDSVDHIELYNSTIGEASPRGIAITSYYDTPSQFIEIHDNTIDAHNNIRADHEWIGDGIIIHRWANNCRVYNNIIKDWGHDCIDLWADLADKYVEHNEFFNNYCTAPGSGYCRGFDTNGRDDGKGSSTCRYNKIHHNRFEHLTIRSQLGGHYNEIYYNIFNDINNTSSVTNKNRHSQGIIFNSWTGISSTKYNLVANNIFANCDEEGIGMYKPGEGGFEIEGNIITNNIIYNCGKNSNRGLQNIGIYISNDDVVLKNTWKNNIIYTKETLNTISYHGNIMNVSDWNGFAYDENIENNIGENPLFMDPDNGDFHIKKDSPAIDAGMDVGLSQDFEGNIVPYGTAPDIGIYEYRPYHVYYIDAINGEDSNSGTSPGNAWKSVSKVNNAHLSPGDFILFKRGCTWREELVIPSGEAGLPITIGAYGKGENPEFNAADVINGWRVYSGNIYVADVASPVAQLFMDGKRQVLARWPNSGWKNIDTDSSNKTYLYSLSLTQPENYWKGNDIVIKTRPFRIEKRTVAYNKGNLIAWDGSTSVSILKNYGFYLEGNCEEVDMPGEWCYKEGKVYLYVEDGDNPNNHLIEGSVRDNGIKTKYGAHDIIIRNITIKYSALDGIFAHNSSRIRIENNSILFSNKYGIFIADWLNLCSGIYIINNNVSYTGSSGIVIGSINRGEIKNNKVSNIAFDEISPKRGYGIIFSGQNILVSNNIIDKVSYDGIFIGKSENVTVSDNVITNCILLLNDGGGIYTGGPRVNVTIERNIVINMTGNWDGTPGTGSSAVGIYLDELTSGVTVQQNIVINSGNYGMLLHKARNNTIINNVFYNNKGTAVRLSEKNIDEMYDNNFYNNIYFATEPEQLTFHVTGISSSSVPIGKFDYNIYYNPYNNKSIKYRREGGIEHIYNFSEWQSASGQDLHSLFSNPLFMDPDNGDFHIKKDSPAIDAGMDVGLSQDFEGNAVPYGTAPDIGVYELVCHKGDFDCNGKINTKEILSFINQWLSSVEEICMIEIIRALEIWKRGSYL